MAVPPTRSTVVSLAARLLTLTLLSLLGPGADPVPSGASDYASAVARQADAERAARSLPSLARSGCLERFADQQARQMAQSRRLSHQALGPVLAACDLHEVGENVAFGYSDAVAATDGWMASATHHDNLLSDQHTRIGVGAHQDADGRWYVSQVLAAGGQDHQQRDQALGRDLVPTLGGAP